MVQSPYTKTTSNSKDARDASDFNNEPGEGETPFTGTVRTSNSETINHDKGKGAYEASGYSIETDKNYESHSETESQRRDSDKGSNTWSTIVESKTEIHTDSSGRKTDSEEKNKTDRSGDGTTTSKSYVYNSTNDDITTNLETSEATGNGTFEETVTRDSKQDIKEELSSTYYSSSTSTSYPSSTIAKSHGESYYKLTGDGTYDTSASDYQELFANSTTASADAFERNENGTYDETRTSSSEGDTSEKTDDGLIHITTDYKTDSKDSTTDVAYASREVSEDSLKNFQNYSFKSSEYDESGKKSYENYQKNEREGKDYSDADNYWKSDGWSEEKNEGNGTFSNYTFESTEDPLEGAVKTLSKTEYHESGDITVSSYKDESNGYGWDNTNFVDEGVELSSEQHSSSTADGTGKFKLDNVSKTTDGVQDTNKFESRSVNGDFSQGFLSSGCRLESHQCRRGS